MGRYIVHVNISTYVCIHMYLYECNVCTMQHLNEHTARAFIKSATHGKIKILLQILLECRSERAQ